MMFSTFYPLPWQSVATFEYHIPNHAHHPILLCRPTTVSQSCTKFISHISHSLSPYTRITSLALLHLWSTLLCTRIAERTFFFCLLCRHMWLCTAYSSCDAPRSVRICGASALRVAQRRPSKQLNQKSKTFITSCTYSRVPSNSEILLYFFLGGG